MGFSKVLAFLIVFSIGLAGIRAESERGEVIVEPVASDSHLKLEIEQLRSKISSLESSISDKIKELKTKDDSVQVLEKFHEEKSAAVARLQAEIDLLKKKGAVVAKEQVGKAHARAGELEKEANNLKARIETLTQQSEALVARGTEAEKKVDDLSMQIESLGKVNDDLKRKLQKTERALQVAEEELMRSHLEATTKLKVLNEIHSAWLPPWIAARIGHFQDHAAKTWEGHGKPALKIFLQKVSEKSAQAQKWAEPHLETAKTKWIPAAEERWMTFTIYIDPHVRKVSTKSIEVYEVCRSTITPHVVKVQESAAPYIQEVRKLSKPYIDQIAIVTKPHVEKVRGVLKPYTNYAVHSCGKFLESTTTYHQQVQDVVQEKLKGHELTESLATKEFVWFMASALLALPMFFLYKIISAVFCKKARKPVGVHANQAHRRHKRRHADK